jgi:rubrerythrin
MMTNVFSCLAMLEDEAYQLYALWKERVGDPQIRLLVDLVLKQTQTHRELLNELSHYVNDESSVEDCGKELGTLFIRALELTRSLRQEVLAGLPVDQVARRLMEVEDAANEEYVSQMHAQARAFMIESDPAVEKILECIANDEKGHTEILELIMELAVH